MSYLLPPLRLSCRRVRRHLFGPIAHLSNADIPAGFYAGGGPTFLEDFEDGSLDGGITASVGHVYGPGSIAGSVDGDDGVIDGSGIAGRSFDYGGGSIGITFTFASAVTAAGPVWTDGAGDVTFEAFGRGGIEVDHVQYGTMASVSAVPLPAALPLMLSGLLGLFGLGIGRRRAGA